MANRPSVYPEWATSSLNNGPLGGANIVEPGGSDKASGFNFPQKPPREWFNWLFNTNYQWVAYLDQEVKYGGQSSFAHDATTTSGLTFGYKAGVHINYETNTLTEVAAGTIALTASQTNYVVLRSGAVAKFTGTWASATGGDIPLWKVVTDVGSITTITDIRPFAQVASGAVDSVNGATGTVVLDADDISDGATTNKFVTSTQKTNWDNHLGSGGTTHAAATTSVAGFMSAADKTKLDGLPSTPAVIKQSYSSTTTSLSLDTGTVSQIPYDSTIPQNTEGAEILTATITPASASNKIKVEVSVPYYHTNTGPVCAAIFTDSNANAIYATADEVENSRAGMVNFSFEHSPSTTSAITYKLRMGRGAAGTTVINDGSRNFGGVSRAILTLTELS